LIALTLRPSFGGFRRLSETARVIFYCRTKMERTMAGWTLAFLVIALIAAVFGFTHVAEESTKSAKVFFTIFVIMFLASFATQLLG